MYELDALQGKRQHMDELIQYTRVIVNLNEEVNAGTITAQDGTFGQRAGDAFANTMTALGEFFTEFGIGFVGALPSTRNSRGDCGNCTRYCIRSSQTS